MWKNTIGQIAVLVWEINVVYVNVKVNKNTV